MLISKGATAIVTLGAIGGGVMLGSYFSSPDKPLETTISDRLEQDGLSIHVSDWKSILDAHNTIQDTTNTFKSKADETLTEEDLQNKCATALREASNKHNNYRLAKRWCVKEQSVSDTLGRFDLKALPTDKVENEDKNWKEKINKVKQNADISKILGVISTAQEDANIAAIKTKCKAIIAVKTTAENFDVNLGLAKQWCSIEES